METIRWFDELLLADVDAVGGKGANLGELTQARLPGAAGVRRHQRRLPREHRAVRCAGAAPRADGRDRPGRPGSRWRPRRPRPSAWSARRRSPSPSSTRSLKAYAELGDDVRVAVRSSGTSEDAGDTSFAGMNATFTNVVGGPDLLARIRDCWASLYGERVVAYRANGQLDDEPAIAVIVQEMVASEQSGVIFTADPTSRDDRPARSSRRCWARARRSSAAWSSRTPTWCTRTVRAC